MALRRCPGSPPWESQESPAFEPVLSHFHTGAVTQKGSGWCWYANIFMGLTLMGSMAHHIFGTMDPTRVMVVFP